VTRPSSRACFRISRLGGVESFVGEAEALGRGRPISFSPIQQFSSHGGNILDGFKEPTPPGRSNFISTRQGLTGHPPRPCIPTLCPDDEPRCVHLRPRRSEAAFPSPAAAITQQSRFTVGGRPTEAWA